MSRLYIAPVSFGLGDLVVSLPAVQATVSQALASGDEAWLVARSKPQATLSERIDGLGGCTDEDSFDPGDSGGPFVDLRDHPLQTDHWWGSPEFEAALGPVSINDVLARICEDLGVEADFSRPSPLRSSQSGGLERSVLLISESDGPSRRWPPDSWRALGEKLQALGYEGLLVTRDRVAAQMRSTGMKELCAPTLGDAVDALSSCAAVVGVDTGLTHIAVQQGTPTVTLSRRPPFFFRPWSHCRVVTGDRCDDACLAKEAERSYNSHVSLKGLRWTPPQCPTGGRCLSSIQPDEVVNALAELL